MPWYRWPALWTALAYTAGILLAWYRAPIWGWGVGVAALSFLSLRRLPRDGVGWGLALLAFGAGAVRWHQSFNTYRHNCIVRTFYPQWHAPVTDPVRVYGTVVGFPEPFPSGWRLAVRVDRIDWRQRVLACRGHIHIWVPTSDGLRPKGQNSPRVPWYPGTRVEALGYWTPLQRYRNPGTHRPLSVMARGLHGRLRLKQAALIWIQTPGPRIFAQLHAYREYIRRVAWDLGQRVRSPAVAAFFQGIWLGDRGEMEPVADRTLRRMGLYHIMAISGLHVGLLAGILGFLLFRLLPCPRRFGYGALTVVLIGYALMVGGRAPVVRAVAMLVLYLIARAWFLPVHPLNLLGGLWCLLLLGHPLWLADRGFQMTFGITAGLLMTVPGLLSASSGVGRWLQGMLAVAWTAPIWSAPWVGGLFGWWPWLAPVWNLLVAPIVGITVALGLVVSGLTLLPGGTWLLVGVGWGLDRLLSITASVAFHPWTGQPVPVRPEAAIAVAFVPLLTALGTFLAIRWGRTPAFRWALWLMAYPWVYGILTLMPTSRSKGVEMVMLDVGQGESILIRTGDRAVLIDGGGVPGTRWDIGTYVVVPALQALGIRQIDAVLMTHPHPDHYWGLRAVIEHFRVPRFYYPAGVPIPQWLQASPLWPTVHARALTEGMHWLTGPIQWTVLNPPPGDPRADPNEDSVVLQLDIYGIRLLLMADVGSQTEARLVRTYGPRLRAHVLKLGHHGSRTSTSPPFLAVVKPQWALCSAGWRNRYGVPHPNVIARLRANGIRVLCTGEWGQITARVTPNGQLTVRTWGEKLPPPGLGDHSESESNGPSALSKSVKSRWVPTELPYNRFLRE